MKKHFTIILGFLMLILAFNLKATPVAFATEAEDTFKKSVIDLSVWDFDKTGPYAFDGYWEFYPNRIILPEDFVKDLNLGLKRMVDMPRAFYNLQAFQETYDSTYGTLRTTVKIPKEYIGRPMALRSTLFYMNAAVYANGKEIIGSREINRLSTLSERMTPNVMASFTPEQETIELVIHFTQDSGYSTAYGNIVIGPTEKVQSHLLKRLLVNTFLFSVMLILGIFNMGFFMRVNRRRKQDKIALYFAFLVMIMLMRLVNSGEHYLLYLLPALPSELFSKFSYWSYYLLLPMFVLFAAEVRKELLPTLVYKISQYAMGFFGLIVLMVGQEIYMKLQPLYYLYFICIVVLLVMHVVSAVKQRAKWLHTEFIAFSIMSAVFLLDSLYVAGYFEVRNYYLFSIFIFICYVTYMVSKSYAGAVDQLENLTFAYDQLESGAKVAEQQYARNLNEKQEVFESLIYQRDVRLTALEKIAKEYNGALVILDKYQKIVSVYGLAVEKHFGLDYTGEKFSKYFFGEQSENGELFAEILERVSKMETSGRIATYLSLLPKAVLKQGRWYEFTTSLIHLPNAEEPHFVITIDDMSKFMLVKQQLQQTQKAIRLLKSYVKYENEIRYLIYRVGQFTTFEIDYLIAQSKNSDELIENMILALERFAIWFEAMGFEKTYEKYQNFILELDRLQKEVIPIRMEDLIQIIQDSQVAEFDAEDRKVLKEHVGIAIQISAEEVNALTDQHQDLLEMLDILRPYSEVLAERFGKTIERIKLEGQPVQVSLVRMAPIVRVLSRLLDAVIVHHIEYYDERLKANKPVVGHIGIQVSRDLETLKIVIEDDGAGININTLKDSLYKLNLLSFKDIVNANDEAVLPYIFAPGVYYKETDNDYYGVGDGLWKVKETIDKLGGQIHVESGYQQYCRFVIELPLEEVGV